jgi:hypothetical protein
MLSFPGSPLSGQSYAAPNGQIYVYDGVKWLGTSITGGGTTTVTNNIENPFSFNVAADDSTQRVISTDELIKFVGTNGITTASDAEGAITISKISELVSVTVPTVGGTASAGEAGITYLTGGLSKWAIFTEGAFTAGVWTDVQVGWTVTDNNGFTDTIAGRGSFGAASFSTTVNDWPSPASGKTYVFTSPDYQAGYTNPIEITVGSNDWIFGANGNLTLPAGFVTSNEVSGINLRSGYDVSIISNHMDVNREWIFDSYGDLTIPGDIKSESNINIDINLADSTLRRWTFGEDGDLTLPRGYFKNDITDGFLTIEGPLFADMVSVDGGGYNSISNGVEIVTHGVGTDTERKFRFSWDGSLYMPTASDSSQIGAIEWRIDGGIVAQVKSSPGGGNPSSPKGLQFLTYGGDTATIISAGFTNKWTFREDGSLTIPGNIRSEGDINIDINLSDSTLQRWTFGEDGSFTVPNGISSFENFEVKINSDDSTLKTFKFDSAGSITLPNSAQIRPSSAAYDEALASWESLRAAEEESLTALGYNELNRPYIAWNVTGENAAEYLAELNRVWQIQGTYPDNGPLVWTPAISSALYNQIRSTLTVVAGDYRSVDNGVSIAVQSSSWETLGKSWNFDEDGKLTFPDGAKYAGQTVTMPTTTTGTTNSFVWEFSDNVIGSDKITLNWNLLASDTAGFYIGTTHSTNGKYLFLDGTDQSLSYFASGVPGGGKLIFGESTNGGAGGVNDIELTSSTGSVRVKTANNSWSFGSQGLLSLGASSGGIYSNQTTGMITIGDSISPTGVPSAPSTVIQIGGATNAFVISAYGPPTANWTFSRDGSLTIPGDIKSSGNINIEINGADSTMRRWSFGEDGVLTFPDGTNQSTAFTGNAGTIDITDTNGIDTNYYLTFVENRDGGEILRADVDLIFNSADNTLTSGNITTGILKINDGVHEKFQELADATGTVTHDCSAGNIFYHSSPDANWTVNLTNINLSEGYATTVTIIIDQGNTGYYPSALQVGGAAQTINWQGNATPTPSTNRLDVVSFSILAVSGGYIVFGQLTGF